MQLDIISYADLDANTDIQATIEAALLQTGIIGVRDVPGFEEKTQEYIAAARRFCALPEKIKEQYAPKRDLGDTEGYELGAERFQDQAGNWQIDDKKASYYAFVPDKACNKWPREVDLRTAYLGLGELIFATGKSLLRAIGLDEQIGLRHDLLSGYGRLLHYHPEKNTTPAHQDWCGAHYDHGVFTGLIPAQYFLDGQPVAEPQDAGLYIIPTGRDQFEKVSVPDQSILLFQVGETGQLLSNDRIRATKHIVKKISQGMERYTFALFYSAEDDLVIRSTSHLTKDARFTDNQSVEGTVTAGQWQAASYARYRAK